MNNIRRHLVEEFNSSVDKRVKFYLCPDLYTPDVSSLHQTVLSLSVSFMKGKQNLHRLCLLVDVTCGLDVHPFFLANALFLEC